MLKNFVFSITKQSGQLQWYILFNLFEKANNLSRVNLKLSMLDHQNNSQDNQLYHIKLDISKETLNCKTKQLTSDTSSKNQIQSSKELFIQQKKIKTKSDDTTRDYQFVKSLDIWNKQTNNNVVSSGITKATQQENQRRPVQIKQMKYAIQQQSLQLSNTSQKLRSVIKDQINNNQTQIQKEIKLISEVPKESKKKYYPVDLLILNNICENNNQQIVEKNTSKNLNQTSQQTIIIFQIKIQSIKEVLIKFNFERLAEPISILYFLQKKPEIGEIIIVNNLVKTTLELFRVEAKINDTQKSSLYYLQNIIRFGIMTYYLITIFQIQIFYHPQNISNPSRKRFHNYLELLAKKYNQIRKIIYTCCKETRELFEIYYKGNSCRQILNQKQIKQLCKSLRQNEISYIVFVQLIIKEIQRQLLAVYKKLIVELRLS